MNVYKKNLSEPWFSLIKLGIKQVVGRLNIGDFSDMKIGDVIVFINDELGIQREFKIEIKNIFYYDNFKTYLETEKIERCLPGIDSLEEGLIIYNNYCSKQDEMKYKVKAFTF
jgi:ASC-1-like (ASCH) protein